MTLHKNGLVVGSSPHTRGARASDAGELRFQRIIPAYAGSTAALASQAHSIAGSSPHTRGARVQVVLLGADEDHPRIRGEHGGTGIAQGADNGSSPHTRGARLRTRRSP